MRQNDFIKDGLQPSFRTITTKKTPDKRDIFLRVMKRPMGMILTSSTALTRTIQTIISTRDRKMSSMTSEKTVNRILKVATNLPHVSD